jgi:protein-tyrosine phosphatase
MPTDEPGPGPVTLRICFVCTGNICRSPMAEVVLRSMAGAGPLGGRLADRLEVSSAGTGPWHVGEAMDPRAAAALAAAGYHDPGPRARQFEVAWLDQLDLAICLDRRHRETLRGLAGANAHKLELLRRFDRTAGGDLDVPDPYYGGPEDFDRVLATIEAACQGLLVEVARRAGA